MFSCEDVQPRAHAGGLQARESRSYSPIFIYPQGPWYRQKFYWRDQFERALVLLDIGADPFIDIWLPDVEPHPEVKIKTCGRRKATKVLLTKEFHTPAGVLRQTVRESEDWCDPFHSNWIPTTFASRSGPSTGCTCSTTTTSRGARNRG